MSRTAVTAEDFTAGVIEGVQTTLITENEVNRVLKNQITPNINHLIKLLSDPHSSNLVDRHEKYIKRLCGHIQARGGILLSELVDLFRAVELVAANIESNIVYGDCLIRIIKLMGGALLKQKTSDEQKYEKITIDSLEQLALLLQIPFMNLRKTLIQAILEFWEQRPAPLEIRRLNNGIGRDKSAFFRNCSKEFHESCVENSKVIATLVQATPLLDNLDRLAALKVIEQMTRSSPKNAATFISTNGGQLVALMLAEASNTNLPQLIDILWNCIENCVDKQPVVTQLSSITSVTSIQAALLKLMRNCHSKNCKETRNDLLVLITQIARHNPSAPFVETSFLGEVISFGCSNQRNLTNSELDFEFLRMLLTCTVLLTEDGASLRFIKQTQLLNYLLLPVQKLDEKPTIRTRSLYQWSSSQKEELQLLSLQLLTKLAPRLPEKFVELNGCNLLMGFLFWSFQTDYSGHGNSILGVGGRGSARAQCRFALRCIRSLCTPLRDPFMAQNSLEDSPEAEMAADAPEEDDGYNVQIIQGFVQEGIIDLLLLTLSNVNNINGQSEQKKVHIY
jgi:hypothetical protein